MDVLLLSRIQFAFTVGFHYIYPPLSIGLGVFLVITEGLYLITKNPLYEKITKFWVKIFALTFAVGVATGIVMEFEFGTNWASYSRFVGDVFGSPLAAEGVFAFFLESTFLGLLLFGWDKVKPKTHFFSTIMVALGAHMSAFWIVVANSWQQTPAGYKIVGEGINRRAEITDFWAMVFNPSSIDRIVHVLLGAWQAGAFLILSISAYYLLKNRHTDFAKTCMKIGLFFALIASVGQLGSGHSSAIGVSKHQPAKLAAFEGLYDTTDKAPIRLFAWVNDEKEKLYFDIKIPGVLSLLVSGKLNHTVKGLREFDKKDRPPVNIVFQAYHAMVGIGMGLLGLSVLGVYLLWRRRLFDNQKVLLVFVASVLGPQLANQLGWICAEVGRQPWVVYGLMRTSEGLSKVVSAGQVMGSILMFGVVYMFLFAAFMYLLLDKINKGPDAPEITKFQGTITK